MKTKNKGSNKPRIPFSIWFWVGFAVLMSVLFYINRKTIAKTVERIQDNPAISKSEIINKEIKKEVEIKKENETLKKNSLKHNDSGEDEIITNDNISDKEKKEEIDTKDSLQEDKSIKEDKEKFNGKEIESEDNLEDTREIELFFATVSSNGAIIQEKTKRIIKRTASPMKDSIQALLEGPTNEEKKYGYRTFIPPDTKLLSATIKDGLATLDFNEDFQFNRYGIEGYNIQLQQVISTVCTFKTVKEVQFLIQGQKRDFLGSEGVWIGSPLSPSSF